MVHCSKFFCPYISTALYPLNRACFTHKIYTDIVLILIRSCSWPPHVVMPLFTDMQFSVYCNCDFECSIYNYIAYGQTAYATVFFSQGIG